MKLKKIASLMLAGVMAVSMLAGCNSAPDNGNGGAVPPADNGTSTGLSAEVLELADISARKDIKAADNAKLNSAVNEMVKTSASAYANDIAKANALTKLAYTTADLKAMHGVAQKIMAGAEYAQTVTDNWEAITADGTNESATLYDFYYVRKGLGENVINNLLADELDNIASKIGNPNPGDGDTYEYTVSIAKADWQVGKDADATKDGVVIGIAVTLDYTKAEF